MSLYGKDDSNANKTKAGIGVAGSSQAKTIVFIDDTEAQLAENKARGVGSPGWYSFFTYTDMHGHTRYKAEHLVSIAGPEANASETQSDDTIGADITSVITPGTVANVTTFAPAGAVATFSDNGGADGSRTAGTYTVTDAAGNASGTGADFSVVVAANGTGAGASLTYQWQRAEPGSSNFKDLSGKTSANTGSLTGLTVAADNGAKYRCVVNNSIGGVAKISTAGTLTVTDRA